ncbi:MAG: hypothetical protein BroJett004_00010 [Planctomycetota bacterium]|nr:MAG: hypothetical protein BroJett004_00010 [Planctomycetota bacterium]
MNAPSLIVAGMTIQNAKLPRRRFRSWGRYARHRNRPESERTLILESLRAVFWLRFSQAA